MADSVMTAKLVIKELAQLSGAYASFMPKPITGVNGSGMHVACFATFKLPRVNPSLVTRDRS